MTDANRDTGETLKNLIILPLIIPIGIHIPLLAWFGWEKLRVPYIVGMAAVFGVEMAVVDWLFFEGQQRAIMLMSHGIFLGLVVFLSLAWGLLFDRARLAKGPRNAEGFVPVHIIFILLTFLIPSLLRAIELRRMTHP